MFRDHPGWTAFGAVVAVLALTVTVAHDLFGLSWDGKPSEQSTINAPPSHSVTPDHSPATARPTVPSSAPGTADAVQQPPPAGKPATTRISPGAVERTEEQARKPACARKITIAKPRSGVKVRGEDGVELRGTACGLRPGEAGWLFDYDPFDDYFYSAASPATLGNGDYVYRNEPIGDPGDNNKFYTLQMVLASAECATFLAEFPVNDEGDKRLRRSDFPSSCRFVAAVDVSVTWPE